MNNWLCRIAAALFLLNVFPGQVEAQVSAAKIARKTALVEHQVQQAQDQALSAEINNIFDEEMQAFLNDEINAAFLKNLPYGNQRIKKLYQDLKEEYLQGIEKYRESFKQATKEEKNKLLQQVSLEVNRAKFLEDRAQVMAAAVEQSVEQFKEEQYQDMLKGATDVFGIVWKEEDTMQLKKLLDKYFHLLSAWN